MDEEPYHRETSPIVGRRCPTAPDILECVLESTVAVKYGECYRHLSSMAFAFNGGASPLPNRGLPCIAAWDPSNISQRWRTPPRIAHFQLSQKSCRRKTICLALWLALHHLHRLRPRCSFRCGIALCSRILPASQYTKADKCYSKADKVLQ